MAVITTHTGVTVPRARYVKVPETNQVKHERDRFVEATRGMDPLALVLGPLLATGRLTVGRFKSLHWYASIVADGEIAEGWPNALSGWGDTPGGALFELAFRWHICLQGSWNPEQWNLKAVPILVDRHVKEELGQ